MELSKLKPTVVWPVSLLAPRRPPSPRLCDEIIESASDHVQVSGSTPPHRSTVVLLRLLFYPLRRRWLDNVTKKIAKYAAIIVFLISCNLQLIMTLKAFFQGHYQDERRERSVQRADCVVLRFEQVLDGFKAAGGIGLLNHANHLSSGVEK